MSTTTTTTTVTPKTKVTPKAPPAPPAPPSTAGNVEVTLPNKLTLKNWGASEANIDSLFAKYPDVNGKRVIPLPSWQTSGNWSGTALAEAISGLGEVAPTVVSAIYSHYGLTMAFNSTSDATGGNFKTQAAAVFDGLLAVNGNMGKVDMKKVGTPLANQNKAYLGVVNDLTNQRAAEQRNVTAQAEASAFSSVQSTLQSWNLTPAQQAYFDSAVSMLVFQPGAHITEPNTILNVLRGNVTADLPAAMSAKLKADYQAAFPGLTEYNASPSAVHMNEQQYNTYSENIKSSAQQYGAPALTQHDIGKLLTQNVSAAEFSQRVTDIYAAVANAPQNVKNLLRTQYGIDQNHLMDYYANGKNALPAMQRQVATAQMQDYAQRVGLKLGADGLQQAGAEQLGEFARLNATAGNSPLGYGISNIQQSLLNASRDVNLTKALPGAATPTINTNTLIGSQLAGFQGTTQPAAQLEVARAEQAKAAPFEKGGGYIETQKGVTGLGSART